MEVSPGFSCTEAERIHFEDSDRSKAICSIPLYDRLRESALTHAEKGAFRSPADCMAEKNAFCILCHFERQAGIALVLPNRQYASKMQIKSSVQK